MDEHNTQAGTLSWGIKESFRGYLSRQADFSLNIYGGATVGAGNTVQFPLADATPDQDVLWAAEGQALFKAHHGMMRLSLKDPIVRKSGSEVRLAFDFGAGTTGAEPDYFEVARLVEVPTGELHQRTFQAFLLPDATGMFNDMYDPDAELDVVTILVEAAS